MDRVLKINQAYSVKPWRRQLQIIVLVLVALVVFGLISVIYLNIDARAAAFGRQIQEHHSTIRSLEKDIDYKQSQLALLTSASEMKKRAEELGFRQVHSDEILYMVVDGYSGRPAAELGTKPELVQADVDPTMSPAFNQSLLDWITQQLSLPSLDLERSVP